MLRAPVVWLLLAVLLEGCAGGGRGGAGPSYLTGSTSLECAPYARQQTGIELYGEAYSWWAKAAGRYARTRYPTPGGVLVFQPSGRLPSGHVSVVSQVVNGREILVNQANWVHRRLSRGEPVLDVSPGNDWTQVRVWWSPSRQFGTAIYPTYGFILRAPPRYAALE